LLNSECGSCDFDYLPSAEKTAWVLNQTEHPVPVLNGGSGPDQHPTRALLNIYTLEREFRTIGGLVQGTRK
jgi:aspartate carbamoyltransferase catalytic subunit